jgi:predicted amidohydrolase
MNDSHQENLRLCLVQSDIHPVHVTENLNRYELLLEKIQDKPDIIVFPEMFACGFSNNVVQIAVQHTVSCLDFLHTVSCRYRSDVIASLPVMENGRLFNRLVCVRGNCIIARYDKKHLFFGVEKELFTGGKTKTVINKNGWNLFPLICYDIRFPNWCRNHYRNNIISYDCLLLIANFPLSRANTLKSLLVARAIENQSYVIALNRIGKDGFGHKHGGNSIVVSPYGKIIAEAPTHEESLFSTHIDMSVLTKLRKSFPVYMDWDE